MSPADLIEKARRCGVSLTLNDAGTGLSLWADGDPPEEVVELLKAHKPDIVAHLQTERRRVNHWIANQIIDWPRDNCLHCRKPITAHPWIDLRNGEAMARFHQSCHDSWRVEQETLARRALGLL